VFLGLDFTLVKIRIPSKTKKPLIRAVFMLALRTGIEPFEITPKSLGIEGYFVCVEFRVEYQLGQMEKFMAKVA